MQNIRGSEPPEFAACEVFIATMGVKSFTLILNHVLKLPNYVTGNLWSEQATKFDVSMI